MKSKKEQNHTFDEVAKELGVEVAEIMKIAFNEGLINEDGSPTQKAIYEGLLKEESATDMKFIGEDQDYKYFVDTFEGIEMRVQVCKSTNQLYFNQEDVAKVLGFENAQQMITSSPEMTDKYLDALNNGMIVET